MGNDNTGTCTLACLPPACGDGFPQLGEGCDDGNQVQTDGCLNNCQLPTCGDGFVGPGEQCDDLNLIEGDGCFACALSRRAFLTSTTYDGNLGGLAGAAAKCQTRAAAAGLGGTWDAWLSADGSTPLTRFVPSPAGYRRTDNTTLANSFADLTDGSLDVTLSYNELGVSVIGTDVWTGTTAAGAASAAHCSSWTTNNVGVTGDIGRSNMASATWSLNSASTCNLLRRLYCFEL